MLVTLGSVPIIGPVSPSSGEFGHICRLLDQSLCCDDVSQYAGSVNLYCDGFSYAGFFFGEGGGGLSMSRNALLKTVSPFFPVKIRSLGRLLSYVLMTSRHLVECWTGTSPV